MSMIFSIFKNRLLVSLIGLFAVALLIWFLGPFFAFADYKPLGAVLNRLIAILILVFLWGLNNIRKVMQSKKANDQIIGGLIESEDSLDSAKTNQSTEEIGILKERFEEALGVLKKSQKSHSSKNLYELPWYIIIGPPGSGKTTSLLNSGLNFPLSSKFGKDALRGVGGTRNCDWWFTDDAVFLDTAGRYTTQDSDSELDKTAWFGFLDLLKRYRKRRPINGILVAMSVSDLLTLSEQDRAAHVAAIKQRIQELYKHFGIRFPVYFMFTKCDLIPGFTEYFDDLGNEGRKQVWGFTFEIDEDNKGEESLDQFSDHYNGLLHRLNDRLTTRLHNERDIVRRSLIFSFPQQFSALKELFDTFINEIFRSNPYESTLQLRGVYFTSGVQEGTPIDRVMGALAKTFGIDQQILSSYASQGKSYFITRLLNAVILQESQLAGINIKLERKRAWLQRLAYLGVLVLTGTAVAAWSSSFFANKLYVNDVAMKIDSYQEIKNQSVSNAVSLEELLPRLDILSELSGDTIEHHKTAPILMGLGLYQGKALGLAANDAYLRELTSLFLPLLIKRIEQQLVQANSNPELQYETLKTYLMLGDESVRDEEHIKLWLEIDWQRSYPSDPDLQNRLISHLSALLSGGMEDILLNENLISSTRANLRRIPLADFAYTRFKSESKLAHDTQALRVSDKLGPSAKDVFIRKSGNSLNEVIPGVFTYEGFAKIFRKESKVLLAELTKENWVLQLEEKEFNATELLELNNKLTNLYLDDYIKIWDQLLHDFKIIPVSGVRHGANVLSILAGPDSPVINLLKLVEENTSLTKQSDVLSDASQAVSEQMERKGSRFERLLGIDKEAPAIVKQKDPGERVEKHFSQINKITRSPALVNHITSQFSELYGVFEALRMDAGIMDETPHRIRTEASRYPQPVKSWMVHLSSAASGGVVVGESGKLKQAWQSEVMPDCMRMIKGRYPFNKTSQNEVTLDDFGQFFGQGGTIDNFFLTNLESLVDKSGDVWRWNAKGRKLGLSKNSLRELQRAELIRNTFFQHGGQSVTVNFTLKPLFLDKQVASFLLDIDGQNYTYRFGPARIEKAQWPGPEGLQRTRIIFEGRSGAPNRQVKYEGPWAWIRALDAAQIKPLSEDKLHVTFQVNDRTAKYEIRASSVTNPFNTSVLRKFKCEPNL